jgi:hypothetical protein
MDADLIKAALGAGGMTGLILLGVWQLLKKALDGFTHAMDTVNQLHKERADGLAWKLDVCEKRHEEANAHIGRLREDCGVLKGRVQALELMVGYRQERSAS